MPGTASANPCGIGSEDYYPYNWYSTNGYDQKAEDNPVSDYVCYLAWFMSGNWQGTGEDGATQGVSVQIENDGYWHVITQETNDEAVAYCIPSNCFEGENSNYIVEWDNQEYPNYFWNESSLSDTCGNGGCDYEDNNNGYPGIPGTQSSLTFLQGWPGGQGATNGNGENAGVNYVAGGPNTLYSQTCVNNEECWGLVQATFGSIFVGTAYTTTPVYPYATGWTTGTYSVDMGTNLSDGICWITKVEGAWRAGSTAGVLAQWNGSVYEWGAGTTQYNGSEIGADYACMAYNINH